MAKQRSNQSSVASTPIATTTPSRATGEQNKQRRRATEDEIRVLAYQKWVSAGQPDGDGFRFWIEAEQELLRGM